MRTPHQYQNQHQLQEILQHPDHKTNLLPTARKPNGSDMILPKRLQITSIHNLVCRRIREIGMMLGQTNRGLIDRLCRIVDEVESFLRR
jgi:hypothetical protein